MERNEQKAPSISNEEIEIFRRRHAENPEYGADGHRWVEVVQGLSEDLNTRDVLDYGCGKQTLAKALGWNVAGYDPAFSELAQDPQPAEILVCTNVLEELAPDRIDATLAHLAYLCNQMAVVVVSTSPSSHHATCRPLEWWQQQLTQHFDALHAQEVPGGEAIFLLAPPVRVFIGSEPRMWIAEQVLCHSIEKHAGGRTRIEIMDHSRGGVWDGWQIGRSWGMPGSTAGTSDSQNAWFTDYTNYRWAVAEHCGFRGRAIYIDVNALVLADVRELAQWPMNRPILTLTPQQTGVMLIDCRAVGKLREWPRISEMKSSGWGIAQYVETLHRQDVFGLLPSDWNCLDGRGYKQDSTRLIHYTDMSTQPWRPYPERIAYQAHPEPELERLWFAYAADARRSNRFDPPVASARAIDAREIAAAATCA